MLSLRLLGRWLYKSRDEMSICILTDSKAYYVSNSTSSIII